MSDSTKLGGQVKIGVILSYALIILNTLYGIFITPYIVSCLGEGEYGVYKTITSLTSSLMVMDLGIGSTVMRFVANYRAKNDEDKISNYLAMNVVQIAIICFIALVASFGIFFTIDPMYSDTFTASQLVKAKSLYIVLIFSVILHIVENLINGVITGYNKFAFGNGVKMTRLIIRGILFILLLRWIKDSRVLVWVDFFLTVLCLISEIIYMRFVLHVKIKYSHWERGVFFESGLYTFMMFLTLIAAQVNNNVDSIIIGAISGPQLVTVYSMGLLIFAMFEALSTSISSVMLPTMSTLLEQKDGMKKAQDLVIKVGRIQFILLGAAVVGFACVGKDFLELWLGKGYEDVYIITLILMIPSLFELCVNVCLSILRAKNLLTFRTITLFASTLLNIIVTVFFVKNWSYIGASIGTAASFIVGSLIVMNIYYYKKLKLPMIKIYCRIFDRIWVCLLVAGIVLYISSRFLHGSVLSFLLNVLIFCIVYGGTLCIFGLNKDEKRSIPLIRNFVK